MRLSPPGTHFTADSTEAMRVKCLAQGHNILMPGYEPSTSVTRNRHSNQTTNMLNNCCNCFFALFCCSFQYYVLCLSKFTIILLSVCKDTNLIICSKVFETHWVKCFISNYSSKTSCFLNFSCNCDLILLNHVMYMIMACILLHFYCMKYLMYITVIMIVGNKVFLTFSGIKI